jgi:hypothetical protein
VSSRERQNQSNPDPYADQYADEPYDDVFIDEGWVDDPYDVPPPAQPRRTQPAQDTNRTAVRPAVTNDGTAAQIDRLRQAMRSGPSTTRQPSTPAPNTRPAPGWRPDRPLPAQPASSWDEDEAYAPAAPPSRQSGSTTSRQPASYQPDPYVDDAQDWDDEYYGEYEDDFSEYDNPRPAPRQRPQLTMPAMSRPSLPPAIANAAIVGDRVALSLAGVGVVGLIAMAILTANRVDSLAPGFATHVSASGILEDIRSEGALWNLPLMATMLTLMAVVIAWFTAPIDRFASRFVLGAALLAQFVAWVALFRLT